MKDSYKVNKTLRMHNKMHPNYYTQVLNESFLFEEMQAFLVNDF